MRKLSVDVRESFFFWRRMRIVSGCYCGFSRIDIYDFDYFSGGIGNIFFEVVVFYFVVSNN